MFKPENEEYKTKEELDKCFKNYCDWCWGHGYGNCTDCRKIKEEATAKLV